MISLLSFLWFSCFSGATRPVIRIPFDIGSFETLWVSGWTDDDTVILARITADNSVGFFDGNSPSVLVPTSHQHVVHLFARSADPHVLQTGQANVIGIGVESSTLREFDSVTIIKLNQTSGEILLGATQNVFYRFCVEESITSIRFFGVPGFARQPVFLAHTIYGGQFVGYSLPTVLGDLDDGSILEVEQEIFDRILDTLQQHCGVIENTYPPLLSNCSPNALRNVETITVEIVNGGNIRLTPQDYIAVVEDRRHVRLSTLYGPHVARIINPFAIPDMNIRLTNSFAEICDSI